MRIQLWQEQDGRDPVIRVRVSSHAPNADGYFVHVFEHRGPLPMRATELQPTNIRHFDQASIDGAAALAQIHSYT